MNNRNNDKKAKSTLLDDDTYHRYLDAQKRILDETGVKPSLKKLVNQVSSQEALNKVSNLMIERLNLALKD